MDFEKEIDEHLPKYKRLTNSIESISKSLLEQAGIEYLSVSGRTKTKDGIIEKIKRKKYKNPESEMTDISGIRIIVFVESDISKVEDIINRSFNVYLHQSSNKDKVLSPNQVGYRSVHYVCDIGEAREQLPEFQGLEKLKFEFQIRTVLQHAWAELAHDRSYKFRGELPSGIQRRLYLHAGLLEIADKGFSEIASDIDKYTSEVIDSYEGGDLNIDINSISLNEFIESWSEKNGFPLEELGSQSQGHISSLIKELRGFGVNTISDLSKLIPGRFAEVAREMEYSTNLFGLVRVLMIINDVDKIMDQDIVNWTIFDPEGPEEELEFMKRLSSAENFQRIESRLNSELYGWNEDEEDLSHDR